MDPANPIPAALELLDYFGIAVFAVSGALLAAEKRQTMVTFIFFAVATGVGGGTLRDLLIGAPTACAGGIIRDVLAGEPSVLMRPELYVTAAALASALFVALTLLGVPGLLAILVAAAAGFGLRGLAIVRGWSLPAYRD